MSFADLLTNSHTSTSSATPRSSSSEDDLASLPFPEDILRTTFSLPTFDTESFLLQHARLRTLDDLRSDLRSWVDKLSLEMESVIELDWMGYLSLGGEVAGGEGLVRDMERHVRTVERE